MERPKDELTNAISDALEGLSPSGTHEDERTDNQPQREDKSSKPKQGERVVVRQRRRPHGHKD